MTGKKKAGKPKISYRDLMAGKTDAPAPAADASPSVAPGKRQAKAIKKQVTTGDTESTENSQRTASAVPTTSRKKEPTTESSASEIEVSAQQEISDASGDDGERRRDGEETEKSSSAPSPALPVSPVVQAVESAVHAPESRELPPARRRDRSRELTPRELAAVLNEEQMAAARAKAEAEAAAAEAEAAAAAAEAAALATSGFVPQPTLNARIIEDVRHRRSSESISSDTMEFAVAAATATLPFRDRVRGRAGTVEVLRFRIGGEYFASDLASAEEALERPAVHRVPEMPDQMLGVFSLRGKLVPVYAPTRVLGAALSGDFGAAVVLRAGDRRAALAIDDVEDVMSVDLAKLHDIPAGSDPEGVLLAVAWHGGQLVSLIDAEALLAACHAEQLAETA